MLARDIISTKPDGVVVDALDREQLDVRDAAAVEDAILSRRPDWVFNCSGITNVEISERDPGVAFAVNADAVGGMAAACARRGAKMLHFSTDYVFEGTTAGFYDEDDVARPVNAYGESKLAGEEALRHSGAAHLLIRTQWLFGVKGRSFAGLMCERAESGQATRVVDDEVGCCTYTVDLAHATWELIGRAEGTLHVANRGKMSRYMLAARIFEHFGSSHLLTSCSSSEFGSTVRRPANSALSVRRAEKLLGRPMPEWPDALARFLHERAAARS